ncbi:hypothetical protein GCM10023320_49750 [Pseudonocardia adelaidensis]|uniref:Uncharacterized protein n=1 Tax=Pseudonocardia adelaidensis TaxID=648754 RepID=A0ABP9NPC9_9PSEU
MSSASDRTNGSGNSKARAIRCRTSAGGMTTSPVRESTSGSTNHRTAVWTKLSTADHAAHSSARRSANTSRASSTSAPEIASRNIAAESPISVNSCRKVRTRRREPVGVTS